MDKKPLEGIKIIDFTHVQAGPACTQLLAWFGADVIKVERPGAGDVTRSQLRDIPNVDALYFTMLNSNKRSLTLDTKKPEGKEVLEKLIKECDVLVENFGPGALDRMGFTWARIQELNPKMIVASVKGFSRRPPLRRPEGLRERRAMRRRRRVDDRLVGRPADHQRGRARRQQHRHAPRDRHPDGADRPHADRQGPEASRCRCRTACINLCRVKLRDQQRLERVGYLEEYPQYPHGTFSDVVPRGGNAGGGGQPGWILKCKGWETDPNAYIYFTIQGHAWEPICKAIGKPEWITDPAYTTAKARQPHIMEIFATIEDWLEGQDEVRGGRHPAQVRHPVLAGPDDEGDPRGQVAARQRHDHRGAAQGARRRTSPSAARSSSPT